MLTVLEHLEVIDIVIRWVPIFMMNVIAFRDLAVFFRVYKPC